MNLDLDFSDIKLEIQPHILSVLLTMDSDTSMNFIELEKLIRSDINISAMILKASNSSFYYRGQQVKDLKQAIARLGFNVVKSIALVAASSQLFESGKYRRFQQQVFIHSIAVGIISQYIAKKYECTCSIEEAFAGGLLHDFGKVVMNIYNRKKYIQVLDLMESEKVSSYEAENEIFGFNHLDAGEWITYHWNFPEIYFPILRDHHTVMKSDGRSLKNLVGFSNLIASRFGYGNHLNLDEDSYNAFEDVMKLPEEMNIHLRSEYGSVIEKDELFSFYKVKV